MRMVYTIRPLRWVRGCNDEWHAHTAVGKFTVGPLWADWQDAGPVQAFGVWFGRPGDEPKVVSLRPWPTLQQAKRWAERIHAVKLRTSIRRIAR